jgi:hypothetical protein
VIACIKEYLLGTKMWVEAMGFLKKINVFKECMMKGIHPYHQLRRMIKDSLV